MRFTEVGRPRKNPPREVLRQPTKPKQSWWFFQRWWTIWTEKPARFRSR